MLVMQCPVCGHQTLEERHGDYRFEPPSNVPGGAMIVSNATWSACTHCGEDILPRAITKAIEAEQRRRRESPVVAST